MGRGFTAATLVVAMGLGWAAYHFGMRHPATPASPLETLRARTTDDLKLARLNESEFVLVNFWASWCGPCFQETPSLIRFTEREHARMAFVTISQDTVTSEFEGFRKIFPRLFTVADLVVHDRDHALGREFDVNSLPVTFIYSNRTRKMVRLNGSLDWDQAGLMDGFQKSLGSGT